MTARLRTRFTERFGLEHPIALAPMDLVAGGKLAAAVAQAGGLGLIGGGYGDRDWLEQAFADAGNAAIGVGFITWAARRQEGLIEAVLERAPKALMVSFGDAEPIVEQAMDRGVPVMWQVQTLAQARQAIAAGTDVIVVQGQEAGGHGMSRGLMSLLPAVRDRAAAHQIVLGAGGVADGRGLAAVLAMGGDGVLMGTRFWACEEAQGPVAAKARMVAAGGDDTVRSKVFDVARGVDWPWHFSGRVVRNAFLDRWHDDIEGLTRHVEAQRAAYVAAAADDYDTRVLIAGEALDLIHDVPKAADILARTTAEAADILAGLKRYVVAPD